MNPAPLSGQTAAVFGGSSGIGLATAEAARALGAEVTIASRTEARLREAAARIGEAETAALDIRDAEAVRRFFDQRDPFNHVVVSAAELGVGPLRKRSLAEERAAFDSKFWGAVNVAHAARIRPEGSLTLVSGMIGVRPTGGATVLSAINAAIDALSKALATEMAPVRVNCVSPGRIETPWWDFLPAAERQALFDRTASGLPLKRIGRPEEIAAQIVHLMQNGFMTGAVVLVDGGGSVA
ncbi:short-chain dehydrogenase/reductase [Mesorhizobium sp. L-8-10]|uniref:SDR family oxidoreductase n=1 Tax=unclassified Mesorhizobium TaxID=325217 RepID=UPI0019296698|nr:MULTISPECIES: SDR family oxidoreductase [unclassified Mesorhizobium]BCH21269.1 short-chain dehydrogenase/reductase [Mesorhizobium sp. L-8-3]BCH29111.1 short-chain dehydrogenase/reductase [Mesorhizobium sp. L-8-10]